MNTLQRSILIAGAVLCLLVLLFPTYGRPSATPNVFVDGRIFVLAGEPFTSSPMSVMFDNTRTLMELLGIALATGIGFAAARPVNHGDLSGR